VTYEILHEVSGRTRTVHAENLAPGSDFHAWTRRFDLYEPPPLKKKKKKPDPLPEENENHQELQVQEEVQKRIEELETNKKRTREFLPRAAKMAVADLQDEEKEADYVWPDLSRRRNRSNKGGIQNKPTSDDAGDKGHESGQAKKRKREISEPEFDEIPGPNMSVAKRPNIQSFPSDEGSSNAKTQVENDHEMEESSDEEDMDDARIEHIRWEEIEEEENPYYIDRIFRGVKPRKWSKEELEEIENTTKKKSRKTHLIIKH
jgi:hypothetical protein